LTTAGAGNTASSFTLATNTVTVLKAGTYLLWYSAAIANVAGAGNTAVFALTVNGTVVPGTNGVTENGSGNGAHQVTGSAAVTLAANATVTVRNISTTADTLAAATDGQTPTSVSLTLLKVG
jgi:hypothetical protein